MIVTDSAQWLLRDNHEGPGMPGSFQSHRQRALRTETGWPDAELTPKIDSDARKVCHEGGKVTRSFEAIAGITDVAGVPVDYLVIEIAPRRSLHAFENALSNQLAALDPNYQAALLKGLDALVTKIKFGALPTGVR